MQLNISLPPSLSTSLSLSLSLPMAAAKKGRKKTNRSSFLCSFGGCFGISNKVSADHGDKKSISGRQPRGALPVNDHSIPAAASKTWSREIHVVEQDEVEEKITTPSADELIVTNKAHDVVIAEKSKNRDESNPITTTAGGSIIKRGAKVDETHRKLSHSVSLPLLHQKRQKPPPPEFDSTVGAVIVSVTLVVMIIWGKIWAILCTAAWFYFVPRFRAKMDESYAYKLKSDGVDFDSWEYKKKVVLQGLLHRNQNL